MKINYNLLFLWIFLQQTALHPVLCQKIYPKREFRGVWIATVNNIDWPSRAGLSPDIQRSEFVTLLDQYKSLGFNAIIVQVRPCADAFYASPYEPWSQWLTGKQGLPPSPFYDPLAFMVTEAKKRNLELHAWINPLRVMTNPKYWEPDKKHISLTKPDWVLTYGSTKLLDPGLPQVREYVAKIVADIVRRYDVHGIHLDDYFYPYPDGESKLNDEASFKAYRGKFSKKSEWRINNIDLLIKQISDSIKAVKPYVKFGVSPYGTWRNANMSPVGSNTNSGYTCYDHLYADVRKWLVMKWIDYVAPQLYQHSQHRNSPFKVLSQWWAKNSFDRHLYLGLASYRVFVDDGLWKDRREMPNQIRFGRSLPEVKGMIFYSSRSIIANQGNLADTLRKNLFRYQAVIPTMKWIDSIPPHQPAKLTISPQSGSIFLKWEKSLSKAEDGDTAVYYAVYRFERNKRHNFENPSNLIALTNKLSYTDLFTGDSSYFEYFVTGLDRLHNESKPTSIFTSTSKGAEQQEFLFENKTINVTEVEYFYRAMKEGLTSYFRLR